MSDDRLQTPMPFGESGTGAPSPNALRRFTRLGCVLFFLTLVTIVYVSYRASARSAERALDAEIERLRADGIIVPIEELVPKVPPGERNAADVYEQAFAAFKPVSDEAWERLLGDPVEDQARLNLAFAAVDRNGPYFDLINEATSIRHCAIPTDWSDPYGSSLRQYNKLIGAARWQRVRAEVLLARGRPDDAMLCAVRSLRAAEHLKAEPTIAAQLCAYITQRVAVENMRLALSRGDPSPATCRDVARSLAGIDNAGPLGKALKGEMATSDMPALSELRRQGYYPDVGHVVGWMDALLLRALGRWLGPKDMLGYLRYQESVIRASSLPWPDRRSGYDEAAADLASVHGFPSVLASLFIAPDNDLNVAIGSELPEAELRAAQVALGAAVYHSEHGRYPNSLDELTAAGWDVPADPFGGGPLHYRPEQHGFVVWSVGTNLVDDNAAEPDPDSAWAVDSGGDITFRCERSPRTQ